MKRNVSVVRLIVATRSSGILISGKIIKEIPGSVENGTLCIIFEVSLHDEAVYFLCNLRLFRHMSKTFSGFVTKFSSNDFIY